AASSTKIESSLGFPEGTSGAELAERAREQAYKFGTEILLARKGVRAEMTAGKGVGYLEDGTRIVARASICATGIEYRRLEVPEAERFLGAGLYYGAGASDEGGYLLTGPDLLRGRQLPAGWPLDRDPFYLETSVPGVFAAGDVRHGSVKRVASAVGEGAMAVAFVHRYLANG